MMCLLFALQNVWYQTPNLSRWFSVCTGLQLISQNWVISGQLAGGSMFLANFLCGKYMLLIRLPRFMY